MEFDDEMSAAEVYKFQEVTYLSKVYLRGNVQRSDHLVPWSGSGKSWKEGAWYQHTRAASRWRVERNVIEGACMAARRRMVKENGGSKQ